MWGLQEAIRGDDLDKKGTSVYQQGDCKQQHLQHTALVCQVCACVTFVFISKTRLKH